MHLLNVREAGIMHLVMYSSCHDSQNRCQRKRPHEQGHCVFSVDVLTPWKDVDMASIKRQELIHRPRDEHGTGSSIFGRKKTMKTQWSFFGNSSTRVEDKTRSTTSLEELFILSTIPQTPCCCCGRTFTQHSVKVCMF